MNLRLCVNVSCGLLATVGMALADPGTISTTVTTSHKGPIRVGELVQVTLRISDYTDPVEIDGFNVQIHYDGTIFEFVPQSVEVGDAGGPDQQWLSKPSQESADNGFDVSTLIEASVPGQLAIAVLDLTPSEPESGTVAASGFLISFQLLAIGAGTSDITPTGYADGSVLFDSSLSPAGAPTFSPEKRIKVKRGR